MIFLGALGVLGGNFISCVPLCPLWLSFCGYFHHNHTRRFTPYTKHIATNEIPSSTNAV